MVDFVNCRQEMFDELVKSMGIPARLLDPDKATVYDKFMDDIEANPNDFTLRSIFADWCEDHGRPDLAACLRWASEEGKHARLYFEEWMWYDMEAVWEKGGKGNSTAYSDLPHAVFKHLTGWLRVSETGDSGDPYFRKAYKTFRTAEEAFYRAWLAAHEKGDVT